MTEKTSGEKPVTATERKSLEKLIEADYAILGREVRSRANEITRVKVEQINEDNVHNTREAGAIRDRILKLVEDAREAGFEVKFTNYGDGVTVKSLHLDETTSKASAEIDADMHRALRLLDMKKNTALRELLRITVSDAARGLLDEMPTAREIFAEALRDQKELTA